jgi:transposase InsO family protein
LIKLYRTYRPPPTSGSLEPSLAWKPITQQREFPQFELPSSLTLDANKASKLHLSSVDPFAYHHGNPPKAVKFDVRALSPVRNNLQPLPKTPPRAENATGNNQMSPGSPKANRGCFTCGSYRHIQRNCPETNRSRSPSPKSPSSSVHYQSPHAIPDKDELDAKVVSKKEDLPPFMNVKILGKEFAAFLDTGSSISVVGDEVIALMDESGVKRSKQKHEIRFLKGTCISESFVKLRIEFKFGTQSTRFRVMSGAISTVLLGRDFLRPTNISVHIGLGGWTHNYDMKNIVAFSPPPNKFLLNSNELPESFNLTFEEVGNEEGETLISEYSSPAQILANWDCPEIEENEQEEVIEVPLTSVSAPADDFDKLKAPAYLNDEQRSQLNSVMQEYRPIFTKVPGLCTLYEHTIDTGNHKPISTTLRHMNQAKRLIFDETFHELQKYDVIEPSKSPWSANGFVVPKSGGGHRVVIDYKPINAITIPDLYPISRMDDMLAILGPCCYFSTFDLSKGFHQIMMSEKDKEKTAFISHQGLWQFKRLAMGLRNSPACFQRCVDQVLGDLKWKICAVYFDDIIVFSTTFDEHLKHIRLVLNKIREAGLTIHPNKVQLCRQKFKFLGFIIEPGLCRPNPEKVECLRNYPVPKDKKNIQKFLGLVGFYRRFIPLFQAHAKALTNLLKKDAPFIWAEDEQKSFEFLKSTLTELTEVYLPDLNGMFIIQSDASETGLGAVLLQEKDKVRHPIWFCSRTLKPAETRYSVSEKECLAVLWAIDKFRGFIEYSHFIIETDHQALSWLTRLKEPTGRLARWFMTLQMYDFEVKYKPGDSPNIRGADALSRLPAIFLMESNSEISREEMINSQSNDPWLKEIIACKSNPEGHSQRVKRQAERSFISEDGLLMRYVGPREKPWDDDALYWRIWVPKELCNRVIAIFHSNAISGHLGIRKTFYRLEQRVFWKTLRRDVARFIAHCKSCQTSKSPRYPPAPASSFTTEVPWDVIAIDLMGPYPKGTNGNTHMLVVVDVFTRYVELFALRSTKSNIIVDRLWQVCCRWGLPKCILSDNGPQFKSKIYFEWCHALGIKTFHISPYHPQANMTERYVQTVKGMIVSTITKCKEWDKYIPELSFALRTARNDSTQFTPVYLNTGREFRTPFDNQMEIPLASAKDVKHFSSRLAIIQSIARENAASARDSSLGRYNLKAKQRKFEIGDQVWVKTHFLSDASKGFSAKLAPKREGPYQVENIISNNVYDLVHSETGQKNMKVHINELSPFLDFVDQDVSTEGKTDCSISPQQAIPVSYSEPTVLLPSDVSLPGGLSKHELVQPESESNPTQKANIGEKKGEKSEAHPTVQVRRGRSQTRSQSPQYKS